MSIRSLDPVTTGFDAAAARNANNSSAATTARKSQRPPAPTAETAATEASKQPLVKVPEAPQPVASQMRFHVDQDTGKTVVSLVDPDSGDVLRQFPSKEALEVAKAIGKYQGMFVNLKV
jgi:flagellar protein FlaG